MSTTSTGALIVALLTFLTAALAAWQARSAKKHVVVVHQLVNNRLTEWIDRAAQLADALTAAGVHVPPAPPPITGGSTPNVQDPGPASTIAGPPPRPGEPPGPAGPPA